jgi:hypothetical protein
VTRERAKWTRDSVSNLPKKSKVAITGTAGSSKTSKQAASAALAAARPTYAVMTLLIGEHTH